VPVVLFILTPPLVKDGGSAGLRFSDLLRRVIPEMHVVPRDAIARETAIAIDRRSAVAPAWNQHAGAIW
jgi:hypothetical protein